MNPDELRALADALDRLKFRCDGIDDACLVEDAADYLRACADAQPVAWRKYDGEENYNYRDYELNEDYADEWNRRNPKHVGWVEPLYTHPAPAAPQAEPKCDQSMLDLLAVIHCDGGHHTEAVGLDQSIKDALSAVCVLKGKLAQAEPKLGELMREQRNSRIVAGAYPDGNPNAGAIMAQTSQAEPKREPLSDEQITKGEYVLATKWGDGDPGDHWGVGFYDRLENGRHYIVDSSGKQIRGNGFRRVGRITAGVGRWLLSAAKSLEASPPGTINLWTMLTERAHGIGGSDAE